MPDYNPDKERHVDHKFVVQNAEKTPKEGLWAGDKFLKFNKQGRLTIKDEKLAREIQKEYPYQLAVTRVRSPKPADQGHNYFFNMPEAPWKRIEREQREQAEKEEKEGKDATKLTT